MRQLCFSVISVDDDKFAPLAIVRFPSVSRQGQLMPVQNEGLVRGGGRSSAVPSLAEEGGVPEKKKLLRHRMSTASPQ